MLLYGCLDKKVGDEDLGAYNGSIYTHLGLRRLSKPWFLSLTSVGTSRDGVQATISMVGGLDGRVEVLAYPCCCRTILERKGWPCDIING